MRFPELTTFTQILTAIAFLVLTTLPARAATLIRDSEIEYALGELARPILNAAGLSPSQVRILLIDDRSLNAFVVDGSAIFIHTGLVLELESAAQLQAVIAHEAAHIANGHISRRISNLQNSRTATGLGILLAAAAAVAGSPEAAGGIAAGVTGSAQRQFLAHTRAEEASADQSSIRYMLSAGVNPAAAAEVLRIFRGQEALSVGRQDPYVRSHPLTRDRIRALEGLIAANPGDPVDPQTAEYWFLRAQAKLSAFTRNPGWTLRQTRGMDDQISLMRQAVAYHRVPDLDNALSAINRLIDQRPNDPFVHELKGQILLENRQAGPAATSYGRAVELAPRDALILAGYGRALLAQDNDQTNARALSVLERAYALDPRNSRLLRDLGLAYARDGQNGRASLAVAERYALIGRFGDASLHAQRALDQLPRGSAPWQKAQDVLDAAESLNRR